jgi:hypothetical protein
MNQLYAIRASGGSYDDAWERVQYVTDDLVKAEKYCETMNAFRDMLAGKRKEIDAWGAQWRKDNPAPAIDPTSLVKKDVPRWDSKTKVTVEMRAERKLIEDENLAAYQAAMKPYYDWNTRAFNEWIEWQEATYPAEILQGLKDQLDDSYWEVELVDWLE